jgi:hypothetical protein
VLLLAAAAPSRADADEAAVKALASSAAAPAGATYAGVAIDRIVLPGLHVRTRDDHTPEHGGVTLAYADDQGQVRVVVRLAVARDAGAAKAFAQTILRGVSGTLVASAPDAAGTVAFTEGTDRLVVAARGNVAWDVEVVGTPPVSDQASAVSDVVKAALVAGAPTFPRPTITLAPAVDRRAGAPVAVATPRGATFRLHATGAYVAHGREGMVLRPFAAGPIEVTAVVADALGRVTETTAKTTAR